MKFGNCVIEHNPFGVPMIGNTVNGCLAGLTPEGAAVCHRMFHEDVSKEEIDAVDPDLRSCLTRGAFDQDAAPSASPRTAYLHVTHRCNLQCVGCYSAIENRNDTADLSLEDIRRIIEQLAQSGVQELIISGGEPFLRDDLAAIVAYANRCGIPSITVLTNGTLISPERVGELAPFVQTVSVSFDGAAPRSSASIRGTQRFDQLVGAIRIIQAAGINAHAIPTIHNGNIGDYKAYCKLADDLGITLSFSLLSISHGDQEAEILTPTEESLIGLAEAALLNQSPNVTISDTPLNALSTRISCGAGQTIVSIAADGTLYPCHMLHLPSYTLGNLLKQELADLLARGGDALPRSVDEVTGCSDCEIRYLCGGGCRARAQHALGDLQAADPYCSLMRRYYELVLAPLATTVA